MIEDRVEKLQDRIEGNQEAELDDTQASVISEFFTLEELEELNYKTMPYMKKNSSGTSNSEGIAIANSRLQPIDSKRWFFKMQFVKWLQDMDW